jgi:hypothetical protein
VANATVTDDTLSVDLEDGRTISIERWLHRRQQKQQVAA